ncbi:DJ-1/PfpI family protein [Kibdelosporangium lantanae]|uniref:DJ-1/PfpI family protein n=1 Tax=Kibdelosporangium lantanae TaxID=1497396 RepID=A0ABW3MA07_9PSEU
MARRPAGAASGVDGCGPGADSAAHGGLNLSQWYLKNMKDYSDAHGGRRYLDYFDQHFYPQISGAKDPETNALRLRSIRSLWDPTYVEESWIGPSGVNAPPLQFIRTMKSWIAQYNPGTKTAITEYNWGALDDINGALAEADILVIPGGPGQRNLMADGPVHDWIRQLDTGSKWTTSVCTGSLILAATGLLKGRKATSHWLALEELRRYDVTPTLERVVFQDKYVTAAGVSAGIDMALTLAAKVADEEVAQRIQLVIEYDPQPPFDAGSPTKAPAEMVEALRAQSRFILEPKA